MVGRGRAPGHPELAHRRRKIAGSYKKVRDWINFFCELDENYMGTDRALEWPLGKLLVERGVYYGSIHDLPK